jgi:hypothetical protein
VLGRVVVAVVLASRVAQAEPGPFAVGVTAGMELAPFATNDVLDRTSLEGSWRWRDRWEVGARLAYAIGPRGMSVAEGVGELGIWLSLSSRIDLLLGWRAGRADFNFGFVYVHAFTFEPVAELAVRLSHQLELRITPSTLDLYRSGVWQLAFGPEVGIAWRL